MKTFLMAVLLLSLADISKADTYIVNRTIGAGSVAGTITTDGTYGVLQSADLTSWNLTLTNVGGPSIPYTPLNSSVWSNGNSDLTATASSLLFNFSNADNGLWFFSTTSSNSDWFLGNNFEDVEVSGTGAASNESGYQVIGSSTAVPEPSSLAMFSAALISFGGIQRMRLFKR